MSTKKTYIYKDRFTGDEMFSGACPHELVDGAAFKVEARMVPKGGETIDVGCGDAFGSGEGEPLEDGVEMVNNVISNHDLQATHFSKKDFVKYIKPYLGRVKEALEKSRPDRVAGFMEQSGAFVKKIISTFDEYEWYCNSSNDYEAGMAALFYKEDGITPCFYFFRDGLVLGYPGYGKSLAPEAIVSEEVAQREGFVL